MQTTFEYTRGNEIDGTPYEVATACFAQVDAIAQLLLLALSDAYIQARSAEMERQINTLDDELFVFNDTPLGGNILSCLGDINRTVIKLQALGRAAAYDPAKPPTI